MGLSNQPLQKVIPTTSFSKSDSNVKHTCILSASRLHEKIDTIMADNSPWIGGSPRFNSQGCVAFFQK